MKRGGEVRTAPRATRWPWLAVALLVALVACNPRRFEPFYLADFEALCEGTPCGWERVSGEAEQATWVETIHPGEHGLRLVGEVSVRGPGAEASDPIVADELAVRIAARCDVGSQLRVDVIVADGFGTQLRASTPITPRATWEALPDVALFFEPAGSGNTSRVVAISITKTGAGACEVSDLALDDVFPAPGC